MSKHYENSRYALAKELDELNEMMTPESLERQRDRADEDIQKFFNKMDAISEPEVEYQTGGGS